MSDKMTILSAKTTGHLLGVITRTGDPADKLEAKDLVGDGLLVRGIIVATFGIARLVVKPDALKVSTVDVQDDVLLRYSQYAMVDPGPTPVLQINPVTAAAGFTVTLSVNGVEVKFPSVLAPEQKVWVQVEEETSDVGLVGEIVPVPDPPAAIQASTATIPLALQAGNYHVLVLVPGYPVFFAIDSVP